MTAPSEQPKARRGWVRAVVAAGVATALFVGVGGFLHTSAGRPWLVKLVGGCPFGRGSVDVATRDRLRHLGLARITRPTKDAKARPALGFELGSTGRAAVGAWVKEHALRCQLESQSAGLACEGVPGRLLGANDDARGAVYFRFDAQAQLVAVLRMQRTRDVAFAVALGEAARDGLGRSLGAPTRRSGELSVASISSGALRQARVEHHFRDFSASTSVTNLGADGYLVTQESQLL